VAKKLIEKIQWHLWGGGGQSKIRIPVKADPKIYDVYIGEYDGSPAFQLKILRRDDRLYVKVIGGPSYELFPESEDKFFLEDVDAQITFIRDDKGKVVKLIVHQGRRDMEGKKVK